MSGLDDPASLHKEAFALYRDNNKAAAALTWARARAAAQALGDPTAAFKAGVWEAEACRSYNPRRAFELVFSLLSDIPREAPAYERWVAEITVFELQRNLRPERKRLQSLLSNLETLATRQEHPAHDIDMCRGNFAEALGSWKDALRHYAVGWQKYNKTGYTKYSFASHAASLCIRLGNRLEAESWLEKLSNTDQDRWAEARRNLKEITLQLALDGGNPAAVSACIDNGCGRKNYELRARLFVRGESLDPLDDPSDPSHPARKLAATEQTQDVHERYDNLLALVDYRLACLRFTAGLPAVDDLYYRQPDVLTRRPQLDNNATMSEQLRLFGNSWRLLMRHATRIDDLLECSWRTQEAMSRRERCDAIASGVNRSQ